MAPQIQKHFLVPVNHVLLETFSWIYEIPTLTFVYNLRQL